MAAPSGVNAAVQAQLLTGQEKSRRSDASVSGAGQSLKIHTSFASLVCGTDDPPALPGQIGRNDVKVA